MQESKEKNSFISLGKKKKKKQKQGDFGTTVSFWESQLQSYTMVFYRS